MHTHTYIHTYIVIVIVRVITTYYAVYSSYRASRTDRWFLYCSMPWVLGLLEVAHSMTEDQEDRGCQLTRLWGPWQLRGVSISNGGEGWPVGSPWVKGQGMAA